MHTYMHTHTHTHMQARRKTTKPAVMLSRLQILHEEGSTRITLSSLDASISWRNPAGKDGAAPRSAQGSAPDLFLVRGILEVFGCSSKLQAARVEEWHFGSRSGHIPSGEATAGHAPEPLSRRAAGRECDRSPCVSKVPESPASPTRKGSSRRCRSPSTLNSSPKSRQVVEFCLRQQTLSVLSSKWKSESGWLSGAIHRVPMA